NVTLRSISEYMEAHPIGGRSMVYIAEPDGALVATSSLVQLAVQTAAGTRRVKAAESDDPIVRGSHAALAGAAPEATDGRPMPPLQVTLDGSEFRVYRTRFSAGPGLDWRIVVAVDPQYFLGGVRTVARSTLLVGAALLALLAALVFGVTRRLVTPIQALDRAAHQIAQGRAGVTVADDGGPAGGQELGSLVAAFNDMSLQLAEARAALDAHAQQLEATVAQRTAALAEANRDLERAHADALAASAAKSAFVAHLSHEIRTPLASITGIGYLLRSAGLAPEQQQRLDVLDAAAQHLLGVVNAVLDIAKIEAGRLELDERPLWVDAIVANVLSMLAVQAAARQIELRAELAPMPPGLLGDPVRLQQMLLNYAANALKFTARGSITVATRLEADAPHEARLRVEVRDTGPGIDAETLARLFQPFQQVAASGGVRPEGWGLGLAITRQLAGLMGGSAGAESTPGRGSVFHFTVRLRKGELPAPAAQGPADRDALAALRERFAGRRVLLVEDSAVNVMITQAILADAGLAVDVAADGESAVARAAAQDYDAILMDVEMPVLDGLG
ncbi:MAG: response regulator, partial [Ideonella sp.]|nr:response regulator [Ideonella sp.]